MVLVVAAWAEINGAEGMVINGLVAMYM